MFHLQSREKEAKERAKVGKEKEKEEAAVARYLKGCGCISR
jgi:hypothetical protein